MKFFCSVMFSVFVSVLTSTAQTKAPVDIANDPHHELLIKNDQVRVFRLALQPQESTLLHRHDAFYAYLSLHPARISNEVRGRAPVVTELKGCDLHELDACDLHTSKGGFSLTERILSSEPAELLVVEAINPDRSDFQIPEHNFKYHSAAIGDLFETRGIRAYTVVLASGGRIDQHSEIYNRLLIALNDLSLSEGVGEQERVQLTMKTGEVRWLPKGEVYATTNTGNSPAKFIAFEFN